MSIVEKVSNGRGRGSRSHKAFDWIVTSIRHSTDRPRAYERLSATAFGLGSRRG
jgi:hypothetical protein